MEHLDHVETREEMFSSLVKLSLPAMFSMLIQSLYNIVDSYFVSAIGEKALRAVSISFPIQIIIIALGVGTGVGVGAFASRHFGARKKERADQAAMHGLILALITWLFLLTFSFFTPYFFKVFSDNETVISLGADYLSIISRFSLFSLIQIVGEKTLQGSGDMISPMLAQLVGAITNIILDPIFIFVFGWGVKGAAIATVVAQMFGALISLRAMFSKKSRYDLDFSKFSFEMEIVRSIYEVGLPSILLQSIGALLTIFLNRLLGRFDEIAVSVLGLYFKLESFVLMPVYGMGQGFLPMVSYYYGAQKEKQIHMVYGLATRLSLAILTIGFVIFQIFPSQLLSIFSDDPAMIEMGVKMLRLISLYFIPASLGIINSIYFQAMNEGKYSLLVSFLRQMGLLVPLAHLLSNLGFYPIFLAYPIAEVLTLIVSIRLYHRTNQKNFLTETS